MSLVEISFNLIEQSGQNFVPILSRFRLGYVDKFGQYFSECDPLPAKTATKPQRGDLYQQNMHIILHLVYVLTVPACFLLIY